MYGYEHKRTEAQFETTWNELQQGLPTTGDQGFLLGVSDNKLLLDGIPLETGNAERSFATLLTTAGLASLHFSKDVTEEDFVRLVRAFTVAGSKAQDVSKQIKEALGANKQGSTIKINEVKFVAADPLTGDVSIAAQIAAQTLGPEFKQWLNDPQKLLQLIAAAEGANCRRWRGTRSARTEFRWFRWAACPTCRKGRQGKMGSGRDSSGSCRCSGNRRGSGVDRRHGSAAGAGSDSGDPAADALWAGAAGSERQRRRSAEGTDRDRSRTRG